MNPFAPRSGAVRAPSSLVDDFGNLPSLTMYEHRYIVREAFFGFTTSTPPTGLTDFTLKDARYWIQRGQPISTIDITDIPGFEKSDFSQMGRSNDVVVAFNQAEWVPQKDTSTAPTYFGTHLLQDNLPVVVLGLAPRFNSGKRFYVFNRVPNAICRLKPKATSWTDSTTLGGSKYRCRIWAPTPSAADISLTTTSSEADFGTEGSVDVLGINRREMGTTNKQLIFDGTKLPTLFDARFEQVIQAGTYKGVAVYSFDGIQSESC